MEEYSSPSQLPLLRGALIAALLIMIGGAVAYARLSTHDSPASPIGETAVEVSGTPTPTMGASASSASNESASATVTPSATVVASDYIDGTYTTTESYQTPGGTENITVSITLAADKVTASSVTPNATNRDSKEYQADFVGGYKQFVTSKDIDTITLSRVSGSSLTSSGFNKALAAIKAQAAS